MWRNRRHGDDFIPIGLRNDLQNDATNADAKGDPTGARLLRLMAAYTGGDAPGHARSLGVDAFGVRYPSARELMRLVRMAATPWPRSSPRPSCATGGRRSRSPATAAPASSTVTASPVGPLSSLGMTRRCGTRTDPHV